MNKNLIKIIFLKLLIWNRLPLSLFHLSLFLLAISCSNKSNEIPEGFQIHPDFHLELVASEPLVFDPIEMKFNENGDAFVMEMPGYPMKDEGSRLILLKDENEDGIYDKRYIYGIEAGSGHGGSARL